MTLVLLPGMDGTGELFAPFLAALSPGCESAVVAYPTSEPFDYAQLESIVRAVLPVDGPYVLLAESFSGPIAISIAASTPSLLKGLVLCASFVRNPQPSFTGLRFLLPALPSTMVPMRILDYLLLGRFSTPALRAALAGSLRKVSSAALHEDARRNERRCVGRVVENKSSRVVPARVSRSCCSKFGRPAHVDDRAER